MHSPSFHKLVLPSALQSKQLRLPDDFMKKYGGQISPTVIVKVPDGSIWRLGLKKADNKFWLVDGWNEFVKRYSIDTGYLLLFKYEGKSTFIVNIFDLASSEINYYSAARSSNEGPLFAKLLKVFEDIMDDEESIEIMDSSHTNFTPSPLQDKAVSGSADKSTPSKSRSPPALHNLFNGSKLNSINWGEGEKPLSSKSVNSLDNQLTRDIGLQFNVVEFKKSSEEVKLRATTGEKLKKSVIKKRKSDVQEPSSEHDEVEMRNRFYESAAARKRTVTAEERERAMNAAKAFEPTNPFCRVVLRPSYLYRGCIMYLPSCFAEKNLNGISGFIKLQISPVRQWPVRCLYKGGRAKLSQGWFEFALENNLGEGDVCVFELVETKEVLLQVTVFRITEGEGLLSPPPFQHHLTTIKLIRN